MRRRSTFTVLIDIPLLLLLLATPPIASAANLADQCQQHGGSLACIPVNITPWVFNRFLNPVTTEEEQLQASREAVLRNIGPGCSLTRFEASPWRPGSYMLAWKCHRPEWSVGDIFVMAFQLNSPAARSIAGKDASVARKVTTSHPIPSLYARRVFRRVR